MKTLFAEFNKGILLENPTLVLLLGLCPALAVSSSVVNGIGMGIAATFVLLGSNIIVSCVRNFIPSKIRIPCFIVIIATFVTIAELLLKAYLPGLSKSLGIFVPLIVVNCIILGRAEAFASQNGVLRSIFDALGMGAGFTLALVIVSAIREVLGAGTILGYPLIEGFQPAIIMILAPGALLTLGLLIGFLNWMKGE
ncbi:RnfABCDGE type electron transport complex subunit E [Candidatus Omnitrophota bacterium]